MYTFPMNNLLLSSAVGIFWLVFLFALCFLGIHVAKLARLGMSWRKQQRQTPPKPESEKKPPPEKKSDGAEPVYYIVERKKRTKSSFGEPKQIKFK